MIKNIEFDKLNIIELKGISYKVSITTKKTDAEGQCVNNPCHEIKAIIQPREKELGNLSVRRVLPHAKCKMVGPWIFFDHMGPVFFKANEGIDIPPHPHINLATVTYLFDGEITHRDSLGSIQVIKPGDINLMVAGSGVSHSERTPDKLRESSHTLNGLQLWLALPKSSQEISPVFYHYNKEQLPKIMVDDVLVCLMMGEAYGAVSPVKCYSPTLYFEACLDIGQTITLPNHIQERAVYIVDGSLQTNKILLEQHNLVVFKEKETIKLQAIKKTKIAVIGGNNIGDRYMWWNFISDTKERIEQAKKKWQSGKFEKVKDDETEYMPLPK